MAANGSGPFRGPRPNASALNRPLTCTARHQWGGRIAFASAVEKVVRRQAGAWPHLRQKFSQLPERNPEMSSSDQLRA